MWIRAEYTEEEFKQYSVWRDLTALEKSQYRKSIYLNYTRLGGEVFKVFAEAKASFLKVQKALKIHAEQIEAAYKSGHNSPKPPDPFR